MIDKLKTVIKREPYLPENSYVHVGFQTQKVDFVWLNLVITFIESRLLCLARYFEMLVNLKWPWNKYILHN